MTILIGFMGLAGCSPQVISQNSADTNFRLAQARNPVLTKWGERSDQCKETLDWKAISLANEREAQDFQRTKDQIHFSLETQKKNCYRIGSEIYLYQDAIKSKVIARALVTKITPSAQGRQLHFDILENYHPIRMTANGDRVPNCDQRFSDWTKYYIPKDRIEESLQQLNNGTQTASVWNGVYNCFRVGSQATVQVKNGDKTPLGTITVKEVQVVRFQNLEDHWLTKTGQSVAAAKEKLWDGLDRDGGLISIVAFEYKPLSQVNP